MRLDTSLLDGIGAAKTAAKSSSTHTQKSSSGASFSSALKAATTSDSTTKTADTTSTANVAETTQAVAGHSYAEVLTGPRAGMYVNTSHNARAGQAFVMVHRNGVELHVYGTGKNRHIVEMRRHSDPAPTDTSSKTSTTTTSTGTTTAGSVTTDASSLT